MKPFYASKTEKELRDLWGSPPEFMAWAVPKWNLVVDAACNPLNQKLPVGLTDSLELRWADYCPPGNGVFCNPPFSQLAKDDRWVQQFIQTARDGRTMVVLCNKSAAAYWWHTLAEHCTELWCSRGRMAFIHPVTGKADPNNNLPQTVFVFKPGELGARRLERFDVLDYNKQSFQIVEN